MDGTQPQEVDNFMYLGCTLSLNTKVDDEVARQITKANQVFDCLQNTIWNRHGLHFNIKLMMYTVVIPPTLLYGAKTWMVYIKQARRLNHFHLSYLRRILKMRWQNRISKTGVLERTVNPQHLRHVETIATVLERPSSVDGRRAAT
nr:unnamed protein product [Spirometra erinaceieuropaei]